MKISRRSLITGIERTKEIDCTQEQYDYWLAGGLVQDAFPNLSEDDREFIMSGITPDEWDEHFQEA